MNRYAYLHTRIWRDRKFAALGERGRLLYLYLLGAPASNMIGYFHLHPLYAAGDLGWSARAFREQMAKLEQAGMVSYDDKACVVFVHGFLKYNPIRNWKQARGALKQLRDIDPSPLIVAFGEMWARYVACTDEDSAAVAEYVEHVARSFGLEVPVGVFAREPGGDADASGEASGIDGVSDAHRLDAKGDRSPTDDQVQVQVQVQGQVQGKNRDVRGGGGEGAGAVEARECARAPAGSCATAGSAGGLPVKPPGSRGPEQMAAFAAFWEAYPRRLRRDEAERVWRQACARGRLVPEAVTAAAAAYAEAATALGRPRDKIMFPAAFLRGRWRGWLPPDGDEYRDAEAAVMAARRDAPGEAETVDAAFAPGGGEFAVGLEGWDEG